MELTLKEFTGCNVCGNSLVEIRGRFPGDPKRKVCPTCVYERLEQINELSSPHYGHACKEVKQN